MHGFVEYRVKVQGAFTSVLVSMPGQVNIELPDGTQYQGAYPEIVVEGLMSKEKIMNPIGQLTLKDLTNSYEVVVEFDKERLMRASRFAFWSRPQETKTGGLQFRKDLLQINIFKVTAAAHEDEQPSKEKVATANGSYVENIHYEGDDEPIWSINENVPRLEWVSVDNSLLLPSDSSVRPDSRHILLEEWEQAEAAKHHLETIQRADKKLRDNSNWGRENNTH